MENPNREGRTNMRDRAGVSSAVDASLADRVSPSYVRPSPHCSSSDHCCPKSHAGCCSQCCLSSSLLSLVDSHPCLLLRETMVPQSTHLM